MLHAPTPVFSELAGKCAEDEIARQASVIETVVDNHEAFAKLLNKVAAEFERTGIGREPSERWYWCGYRESGRFSWDAYVNRMAKTLKRPYVFCNSYNRSLVIEKKAYTRPLYAHLLLAAIDGKNRPWHERNSADVWYEQTGSRITFHFNDGFGVKLHDDWFKQAKTDPEFRKALRLPDVAS